MSRPDYEEMVEAVKRYIYEGDVIQTVVAQRFSRPTSAHPFEIYRALRAINRLRTCTTWSWMVSRSSAPPPSCSSRSRTAR